MTQTPEDIAASLGRHESAELLWLDGSGSPRSMSMGNMWLSLLDNRGLIDCGRSGGSVTYTVTPLGRAVAAAIRERG
jgi:hypothetical protein